MKYILIALLSGISLVHAGDSVDHLVGRIVGDPDCLDKTTTDLAAEVGMHLYLQRVLTQEVPKLLDVNRMDGHYFALQSWNEQSVLKKLDAQIQDRGAALTEEVAVAWQTMLCVHDQDMRTLEHLRAVAQGCLKRVQQEARRVGYMEFDGVTMASRESLPYELGFFQQLPTFPQEVVKAVPVLNQEDELQVRQAQDLVAVKPIIMGLCKEYQDAFAGEKWYWFFPKYSQEDSDKYGRDATIWSIVAARCKDQK